MDRRKLLDKVQRCAPLSISASVKSDDSEKYLRLFKDGSAVRIDYVQYFKGCSWSLWSSRKRVSLLDEKPEIRAPGQTSKQNTKSISSAIISQLISGKSSESK